MLNQFLKMMNSKNTKTQRQRQNKIHIPGLAKGGAVLVAIVTDRPTHSREQKSYIQKVSPRFTEPTGQ
jgi:hypothetical protein